MKVIKRVISAVVVVIISISLASCKNRNTKTVSNSEYKYGKIKIQALGGGACGAPSYVAYEKGFFKKEGLDVELTSGTLDENKAGLTRGQYIVTNGDFHWFSSIQQGMNLRIVGGLHQGCIKIVVPPNSSIKSGKDLKGKTIGVDVIGGTPMAVSTVLLAKYKINPQTDVKWKAYPLDQMTQAVRKGEIDAFAAWDPYGTLAVNQNSYRILSDISTDPLFANRSCCFLYASQVDIDKNPDKVKAVVKAYKEADDWIKKHPEEAAKIEINKKYVATKDLKLVTSLIKSYNYNFTTDKAKSDIRYFVNQFKKTGFLKKDTDTNEFVNKVYYNAFN